MRARARMLAWNISHGSRVNSLSGPWPMLLYTWLIPHADNLGRQFGEPEQVKANVLPRRKDVTAEHVAAWLQELSDNLLIHWYEVAGMRYIAFPKTDWDRHQKLRGNMRITSDLPDCPHAVYTEYARRMNGVSLEDEVEGKEKEKEEGKGEGECRGDGGPPNVNTVRLRETGFKTANPEALRQAQALRELYPEAFR